MRAASAFQTLWMALVAPSKAVLASSRDCVATMAAAVIVLVTVQTVVSYAEATSPQLASEAERSALVNQIRAGDSSQESVEIVNSERSFTAQLGTVMITTIAGLGIAGLVLMLVGRFLTNEDISFTLAIGAVASSALIDVARLVLYLPLHLLGGSVRWGIHLGAFVSPEQHPFLFSWLAKVDPLLWWQYVVMAIVMSVNVKLHYRYGIVIGTVVYLLLLSAVGGFAFVGYLSFGNS